MGRPLFPSLLLGALVLATPPPRAVAPADTRAAGCAERLAPDVHDGAWWNRAASTCKYAFLTGTLDGMEAGRFLARDDLGSPHWTEQDEHAHKNFSRNNIRYFGSKGSVDLDRLGEMLDTYYRNPTSKGMAVIGAILVVSGKNNGVPSTELKEIASYWSGWYD